MAEAPVTMWTSEWWISVVVVSIGFNVASAYLKSGIDRIGSKMSLAWATRNARKARARLIIIEHLRHSEEERQTTMFAASHRFMAAILYAVLSTLMASFLAVVESLRRVNPLIHLRIAGFALCVMGLVFLLMAVSYVKDYISMWKMVREAQKPKATNTGP